MAEVTKERLLEFIRNNDLDLDESYPRSDWWKFRDERDAYKKQRDELINDMAEVKRKAEAFDEILNVDYIVAPDDYAHEITKIVDKYREEQ
ncbi:hypothetical protein [Staphylococcus haemolyticus]|uniref:hypothetical protein n=1 Tax=Staphylococcus haemolyticus TaxID=1283 RepID=UPI000A275ABA|nr:hypothetical protein [Staphylococcus haemolyticus]ARM68497.1 hypothetical protein [Staphylococcus phage IME1365_01]MCH4356075.1 hypothetical protein [Staphylococcus haemolyticus]MCH4365378.1 hypothetical protein [Staphylococcus haemolyticus]MCH4367689.1 hypothetical protein [Staphylococcus haemolyticus]MCH4376924.1 hypothetical protein [Staphylococcus haemolyticus]